MTVNDINQKIAEIVKELRAAAATRGHRSKR